MKFSKEHGKMVADTAMEDKFGQMVQFLMGTGKIIWLRDMDA